MFFRSCFFPFLGMRGFLLHKRGETGGEEEFSDSKFVIF